MLIMSLKTILIEDKTHADLGASTTVQQIDERLVTNKVKLMKWAKPIDLVAVVSVTEEMTVNRLVGLKKIWSYTPQSDEDKIIDVAWEPRGKLIAVALSTQKIVLLSPEKGVVVKTHHLAAYINSFNWIETECTAGKTVDTSNVYLPDLPVIEGETDKMQTDWRQVEDLSKGLTYLLTSCDLGVTSIYVNGLILIARVDFNQYGIQGHAVLNSIITDNCTHLHTISRDFQSGQLHNNVFDISEMKDKSTEIQMIYEKFVIIHRLIEYCELVLKAMDEFWEENLLELDTKITQFIQQRQNIRGENTVLNEFLELLMFGKCSNDLSHFLVFELTEKGMKKLGQSLNSYYANVYDLVNLHLQRGLEAIHYQLHELCALSKWKEKYASLGLSNERLSEALQASGSVNLKVTEMAQMLSTGTHNLKHFCIWLYSVVLSLSDKEAPTPKAVIDHQSVAEFLYDNFYNVENSYNHLRLERVGQYLKDANLVYVSPVGEDTFEYKFNQIPELTESPLIYKNERNKSLIQVFKNLQIQISEAFTDISVLFGQRFNLITTSPLQIQSQSPKTRQFTHKDTHSKICWMYTAMITEDSGKSRLCVYKTNSQSKDTLFHCILCFGLQKSSQLATVVDFDHFKQDSLMVLIKTERNRFLTSKIELSKISPEHWSADLQNKSVCDVSDLMDLELTTVLHNTLTAQAIAVSPRDIGCVLVSDRRIRLFDYAHQDEEDDTIDITADNSLLQDESMDQEAAGGSDKENCA